MKNVNTEKNIPAIVDDVIITINDQKYEIKGNRDLRFAKQVSRDDADTVNLQFNDFHRWFNNTVGYAIRLAYLRDIISRDTAAKLFDTMMPSRIDELDCDLFGVKLNTLSEDARIEAMYENFRGLDMGLQFIKIIKDAITSQKIHEDIVISPMGNQIILKADRELKHIDDICERDESSAALSLLIDFTIELHAKIKEFIRNIPRISKEDVQYCYSFLLTRDEQDQLDYALGDLSNNYWPSNNTDAMLHEVGQYLDILMQIGEIV